MREVAGFLDRLPLPSRRTVRVAIFVVAAAVLPGCPNSDGYEMPNDAGTPCLDAVTTETTTEDEIRAGCPPWDDVSETTTTTTTTTENP